jgi:hypothetical protein
LRSTRIVVACKPPLLYVAPHHEMRPLFEAAGVVPTCLNHRSGWRVFVDAGPWSSSYVPNGKKQKLSLVQTMSPLREARPEAKLLILGEGEEREPLQQEIHERGREQTVLLIGERHDIPNLLAIRTL